MTCINIETKVADLPAPVGPNNSRWPFMERSKRDSGSNDKGAPPRLKKVMPGLPVPMLRPHSGSRLATCWANSSRVYQLRVSRVGL
ncbi:hypothetical protein D3C73_1356830 [compost metagenome]